MNILLKALAALALTCIAASASATSYSGITIFGDSMSDTGNWYVTTGGTFPATPYYQGRFSNGLVWVDHLAGALGSQAVPSLMPGGNNYAWGDARTGLNGDPVALPLNVLTQTASVWAPSLAGPADPNRLYVLVGGVNDMRDARSTFQGATEADQQGRQAAAEAAVANLAASLDVLAGAGAKHVLVANMGDLGRTPEAMFLNLAASSSDASSRFNTQMPGLVAHGQNLGLNMMLLDVAGLSNAIFNDALKNGGVTYGITNVSTPCAPFPGNVGIPCDVSGFSDALHPSARAHEWLGFAAVQVAAIPEPQIYVLMALGLGLLAWRVRRLA